MCVFFFGEHNLKEAHFWVSGRRGVGSCLIKSYKDTHTYRTFNCLLKWIKTKEKPQRCVFCARTHTHTRLRESLALGAGRQETRNQCIHLSPASSRARPAEGKGYRVTRKKQSTSELQGKERPQRAAQSKLHTRKTHLRPTETNSVPDIH